MASEINFVTLPREIRDLVYPHAIPHCEIICLQPLTIPLNIKSKVRRELSKHPEILEESFCTELLDKLGWLDNVDIDSLPKNPIELKLAYHHLKRMMHAHQREKARQADGKPPTFDRPGLNLLLTSRKIHTEISEFLFATTTFRFDSLPGLADYVLADSIGLAKDIRSIHLCCDTSELATRAKEKEWANQTIMEQKDKLTKAVRSLHSLRYLKLSVSMNLKSAPASRFEKRYWFGGEKNVGIRSLFQPFLNIASLGKVEVEVDLSCRKTMLDTPSSAALTQRLLDTIRPVLLRDLVEMLDPKTRRLILEVVKTEGEKRKDS